MDERKLIFCKMGLQIHFFLSFFCRLYRLKLRWFWNHVCCLFMLFVWLKCEFYFFCMFFVIRGTMFQFLRNRYRRWRKLIFKRWWIVYNFCRRWVLFFLRRYLWFFWAETFLFMNNTNWNKNASSVLCKCFLIMFMDHWFFMFSYGLSQLNFFIVYL